MARSRLLIVVAFVLILLAGGGGAAYYFLIFAPSQPALTDVPTPAPVEVTATPVFLVPVAAQSVPRGAVIPTEVIVPFPWPTELVPLGIVTDVAKIVGSRARISIERGSPILSDMLLGQDQQLAFHGSDTALQIPAGLVALTVPYDKRNGVALGAQDGDHVNLIISFWVVDLDEEFQTILPNLTTNVQPPSPGSPEAGIPAGLVALIQPSGAGGIVGRSEREATIGQDVYLIPSETSPRSRLVTQGIIQDALILHIGDFSGALFPTDLPPTNTPDPAVTQPPPALPTNTPLPPDSVTLIVSPQDALVLNYVKELMIKYPGAVQLTLALRSAMVVDPVSTESVTMQYMFERFNISVPSKLNYGLDKDAPTAPAPTPVP